MNNRGVRRSALPKSTIERQARVEAARAHRIDTRAASNIESPSPSERALTIRQKIARWLEQKL
jgi:hypothetical protein